MSDELEAVTGYVYTHFDCPACGMPDEREGDIQGDVIECY
jgi:hypothetical protein